MHLSSALLVGGLLLSALACGGGGSQDSSSPPPPPPPPGVAVVVTPSDTFVAMDGTTTRTVSVSVANTQDQRIEWRWLEPEASVGVQCSANGLSASLTATTAEGIYHLVARSLADPRGVAVISVGITRTHTAGVSALSDYVIGSLPPSRMTESSDGRVWFTESLGPHIYGDVLGLSQGKIGFYMEGRGTTEFLLPFEEGMPHDLVEGPDGRIWFTEWETGRIGCIDAEGVQQSFALPDAEARPFGITVGIDGNLWFTERGNSCLGCMNTRGELLAEWQIPFTGRPGYLIRGLDGALWFPLQDYETPRLVRATVDGVFSSTTLPYFSSYDPLYLAQGNDGTFWLPTSTFSGAAPAVYQVAPDGTVTQLSGSWPLQGFTGAAVDRAGNLWLRSYNGRLVTWTPEHGVTDLTPTFPTGEWLAPGPLCANHDGGVSFSSTKYADAVRINRRSISGALVGGRYSLAGSDSIYSPKENIRIGPDGWVWFTEPGYGKIGKRSPDGRTVEYSLSEPWDTPRAFLYMDHAWVFGAYASNTSPRGSVAAMTISGEFTSPPTALLNGGLLRASFHGLGGSTWLYYPEGFSGVSLNNFVKLSATQTLQSFSFMSIQSGGRPSCMAMGADGRVYLIGPSNRLFAISDAGACVEVPMSMPIPPTDTVSAVVLGPEGRIWVLDTSQARIYRVSPSGQTDSIALSPGAAPECLCLGGDGTVWVMGYHAPGHQPLLFRISREGVTTQYSFELSATFPSMDGPFTQFSSLTWGPGGCLWATDLVPGDIWKISIP